MLSANNKFFMFVAILNAIPDSVFFSSCHISLALSVHFACTRSFSPVVLTQFCCCFKITVICELVVTGNKMVPAKYDTGLLLQQITRMCFGCFKKYASQFEHGLQKTILKLGFCNGNSSSRDAKVKTNWMARKEGNGQKPCACWKLTSVLHLYGQGTCWRGVCLGKTFYYLCPVVERLYIENTVLFSMHVVFELFDFFLITIFRKETIFNCVNGECTS